MAPSVASFADLLQSAAVDVVHVCTPPETHVSLAELALNGGCHVYVEKPFTETSRDAAHLLSLARETGREVCVGHQLLFERFTLPGRGGDEVVELLNISGCHAGCHRLNALALARTEQSLQVDWRPAALLGTPEPGQEGCEPSLELVLPVGLGAGHHGASREHLHSLYRSNLAE